MSERSKNSGTSNLFFLEFYRVVKSSAYKLVLFWRIGIIFMTIKANPVKNC